LNAQTIWIESDIDCSVDARDGVQNDAWPDRMDVCAEEPRVAWRRSGEALIGIYGAALCASKLARLPWPAIGLGQLKSV
jgi:hypothetical protein